MTTTSFNYDYTAVYFEDGYCASVMECTDDRGNLSLDNAKKLLNDQGSTYKEFVEENGVTLHAPKILDWLGY